MPRSPSSSDVPRPERPLVFAPVTLDAGCEAAVCGPQVHALVGPPRGTLTPAPDARTRNPIYRRSTICCGAFPYLHGQAVRATVPSFSAACRPISPAGRGGDRFRVLGHRARACHGTVGWRRPSPNLCGVAQLHRATLRFRRDGGGRLSASASDRDGEREHHCPNGAAADPDRDRMARAGCRSAAGIVDHGASGHDHCGTDARATDLQTASTRSSEIPRPGRAVRQRVDRWDPDFLRRPTGADGRFDLAVGQRFHARHLWLEGCIGCSCERHHCHLCTSQAFAGGIGRWRIVRSRRPGSRSHDAPGVARRDRDVRAPSGRLPRAVPDVLGLHASL
ncbi:hypothetical protein FQZ97_700840 [compost metagenome]